VYNYLGFFQSSSQRNMNMFNGCRETLIGSFKNYISRENPKLVDDNYFFCHIHRNLQIQELLTQNCLNLCRDIWKDKSINCEIIKFKDINSKQVTEHKSTQYSNYSDLLMIKVNKIINPIDISLILWASWYGINRLRGDNRKYYVIKKCSDLFPDLYIPNSEDRTYYNGPRSFMQSLKYYSSNYLINNKVGAILKEMKGKSIIDSSITVDIRSVLMTQ
jgi:hypothetical protein